MVKQLSLTTEDFSELATLYDRISEIGQDVADRILEIYCLYQIATGLSISMDLKSTIGVLERLFKNTLKIDAYALMILSGSAEPLKLISRDGFSQSVGENLLDFVNTHLQEELKQRKSYLPLSAVSVSETKALLDELTGELYFFPLFGDVDQFVGCLTVFRKQEKTFKNSELTILEKICYQLGKGIDKILTYEHTRELSITDELTQIFNRRYFNQRFEREMERAIRYNRPLTVIMADIDHFKNLNDTYGHFYGDEVLKTVASILDKNLRRADILARFGGEEFVILLPEIDKSHGHTVAEKLRHAIESYPFHKGSPKNKNRITLSLGLAAYPEDALNGKQLLERADRALYLAKSGGRNRVVAYQKKNGKLAPFSRRYRLAAAGTRA